MKLRAMSMLLALGAPIWAGAASPPAQQPQISNYQTPGNLESTHTIDCGPAGSLTNKDAPPDLYNAMVKCVNENHLPEAVYFFALAGTYSYFDGLRVADETAHQAHQVLLRQSLDSLDKASKDAFWQAIQNTLGDKNKLPAICADVSHTGAPQYYPRYMVQHGMNAVLGKNADDGLVKDFNADAAWKKALAGYLHCP